VATPLEALAWLERPDTPHRHRGGRRLAGASQGLDVLDFVGENHPRMQRVVMADGFRVDLALRSGRAHRRAEEAVGPPPPRGGGRRSLHPQLAIGAVPI
jgi:hypothetical protein